MVAIVSGNGLGLNLTSKGVLGNQGVLGDPATGQGTEEVYVDAATGNLVVQQLQDELVGPGLNVDSVLTYNSQGLANDDNGDNFSLGQVPAQLVRVGTVNTAGSTLTVTNFDGSAASYSWDAAHSRYVTTAGGGVYGVVTYDGSKYTLFDGSTQETSIYDGTTGRLLTRADTSGNKLTYGYDATSGLMTSVTDAAGETVAYGYAGTLLKSVSAPVVTHGAGTSFTTATQPVVTYGYDGSNRLATVTVDLSPDGSIADGNAYVTTFTYDGASKRIASMKQSDGTTLSFSYDASNRVYKITDGLSNVTTFAYDTTNRKTSVLANGQTTVYAYDANGQLLSVTSPAVNGTSSVQRYAYNANGDVVSTTDADGRTTQMTYDASGNMLSKTDAAGEITMYAYDSKQRLITQTTSLLKVPTIQATPASTGAVTISGGNIQKTATTAAWDTAVQASAGNHVNFTAGATTGDLTVGFGAPGIGNTGPVTYASLDYAFRLNAGVLYIWMHGALVATGAYSQGDNLDITSLYQGNYVDNVTFSQNGKLLYTANNQPDKSEEIYAAFFTSGAQVTNLRTGYEDNTFAYTDMTTRYVYSDDGRDLLRFKIDPLGEVTEYGYDAHGNLISTNLYANATYGTSPTQYYQQTTYDTSGLSPTSVPTEATMVAWRKNQDLTQTDRTDYARDARGQLTTTTAYSKTAADGTGIYDASTSTKTTYVYDASGNLLNRALGSVSSSEIVDGLGRTISSTDGLGRTTLTAYAGSTIKTTAPNGLVTTQAYDADGRLISVANVSGGSNQDSTSEFYDANGNLLRSVDATNVSTWSLYDAAGRRVATIDGNGVMTEYVLDPAGLVTQTIAYATPVNTALLVDANGNPTNPSLVSVRPAANAATDRRILTYYDSVGRVSSTVDSAGLTTSTSYDAAGRVSYVHASDSATGAIRGSWMTVYDADGNLLYKADEANSQAVLNYNAAGNLTSSSLGNHDDDTATLYDRQGRVVGQLQESSDGTGAAYLTETVYNVNGLVDHVTRYATAWSGFAYDWNGGFSGLTIDAIRPAASSADQTMSYAYDAGGRLTSQTDPTGVVTSYAYEANTNRIVSITTGASRPDATTVQKRYDAWGRVTAVLSAVGSSTLGANPTPAQVSAAWAAYSTQYTYDAAGRLATQTDPLGNTTTYFYDNNGQLRYTVDPKDMVTERRYDSFGNVTLVVKYATAISPTGIGAGGLATAALTSAVAAIAQPTIDNISRNVYDTMGHLTLSVNAAGAATTFTNNQFGDVVQKRQFYQAVSSAVALSDTDAQLVSLVTASADAVHDQTTSMSYTAEGRLAILADPTGAVTTYTYSQDFRGNATAVTQLATRLTSAQLNDYAHLSSSIVTSSNDRTTNNLYDEQGRLILSFDPAGFATEYTRDAYGNITTETQFAKSWSSVFGSKPITVYYNQLWSFNQSMSDPAHDRVTKKEYDADGRVVYGVDALGHATRLVYDAMGNVIYRVGPDGSLTCNQYDADGRVIETTAFATLLSATTMAGLAHGLSASQAGALVPASSPSDAVLATQYDAMGRVRFTMDGTGAVTERRYDVDGNVVDSIAYATKIAVSSWSTTTPPTVTADTLHDRHIHSSYDAYGNVIAQSDGTGAVVINTYDADGRLTDRLSYANRIVAGSWTSGQLPTVTADATRDIHERFAYNALGHLTYSADGTGAVTAYTYDADGDVTQETLLATPASAGQTLNTVAASSSDRTQQFGYDTFGRRVWHADATGALTYTGYDADGNIVQTIQYAQPISGGLPTGTAPLATAAADRVTSFTYNAFGQVTYTVDALNRTSLNSYFQDGTLRSTTRYAATIGAGASPGTVTVNAAVDETTQYLYDAAGHVLQRTDALGGVQSYTYDGLGNKLTFTNEKSATWNYAYDADGRLLTETTPHVDVTTVSSAGAPTASTSSMAVVTAMTYDGTGNLLTRVEASGSVTGDARTTAYDYDADGRQTKVTSQAFGIYSESMASLSADALVGGAARQEASSGSTISTTFYDAFGNAVANVGTATTGQSAPPVSYKVYDQANRLRYEIDAKGYVTGYARDVFGEAGSVIRYSQATALGLGVPTNASTAPSVATITAAVAAPSPTNREIDYVFDAAGRITQTSGPVGTFNDATSATSTALESNVRHVVVNTYDAFGDVIKTHDLQNSALGVYADTYNYFDGAGNNTATVDPLGYLTRRTFDAFGNLQTQVEYASRKTDTPTLASYGAEAPAATTQSGPDRTTSYTYDLLNRKSVETHTLAFENATDISGGTYANSGSRTSTSYGYDAVGNLTRTANESGVTYLEYDVLGRLRATIQPAQTNTVNANTLSPVTEFWYDEFGQRTVQIQHANGATAVTDFRGNWTNGTSNGYTVQALASSDRTTMTIYDKAGHVTEVDAPMSSGANTEYRTYSSYDAAGRVAKTWHTVSGKTIYQAFVYDAVGQLAVSYAPSAGSAAQHAVDTEYTYNSFGEMTAKGVKGTNYESYDYDNNGNLWRSKSADGVVRVYMYDLSGRQSSLVLSNGTSGSTSDLGSYSSTSWAQAYANIQAGGTAYRRTDTVYDKVGNAVATLGPQRLNSSSGFSLNAGALSVSWTTSSNTATVTATYPDLTTLGNGDVMATVNVTVGGVLYVGASYFTSLSAATGLTVTVPTGAGAMSGTPNVVIAKKNVKGVWQTVASTTVASSTLNRVEVAAPTGVTGISMTYTSQGQSPITANLSNFGSLWTLDLGSMASAATYTLTFTYPDGTTSTTAPATFVGRSSQSGAPAQSVVRPVTQQIFDRWGNMLAKSDPRSANWWTNYQYNANNQLIKTTQGVNASGQSVWSGFDNGGNIVTTAPTTLNYYDAQGDLVESIDADGHKTVQKFDSGHHVIETDSGFGTSDLSVSAQVYDAFGDAVDVIAGNGFDATGAMLSNASDFTTLNTYDNAGNLRSVQHGTTAGGNVQSWFASGTGFSMTIIAASTKSDLTENYTYDADGHKLTSTDAANETTTYTYDAAGNLLTTTLPAVTGQAASTTTYNYDDFGHLKTKTDADGISETWNYDYFGRLGASAHTDLSSHTYSYTYDNAGDLLTQTNSAGQSQTYSYDGAGQLIHLSQVTIAAAGTMRTTDYVYDMAGNHIRETTSQVAPNVSHPQSPPVTTIYQDNHLAYDALGRLMDSSDESVHVGFGYDAAGNRIHTQTHVILDAGLQASTLPLSYDTDYWNAFDALNRQIHVDYTASYDGNGHVTGLSAGPTSHGVTFDRDGNRLTDTHIGNTVVVDHIVSSGGVNYTQYKVGQQGVMVTDNYVYDADDRLDHTWRPDGSGQRSIDVRRYDAAGRTLVQGNSVNAADGTPDYQGSYYTALNYGITDTSLQYGAQKSNYSYNADGRLIAAKMYSTQGLVSSTTDYSNATVNGVQTQGYDLDGNLMGDITKSYNVAANNGSVTSTQSVTNTLNTATALESLQVSTTKTTVGGTSDTATTTYDAGGTIVQFNDPGQTTFSRNYFTDVRGQVLSTSETSGSTKTLMELVVNGEVIGQYGTGLDPYQPQKGGTGQCLEFAVI